MAVAAAAPDTNHLSIAMDVGVERTFSPQNFSMFSWMTFGLRRAKMLG